MCCSRISMGGRCRGSASSDTRGGAEAAKRGETIFRRGRRGAETQFDGMRRANGAVTAGEVVGGASTCRGPSGPTPCAGDVTGAVA